MRYARWLLDAALVITATLIWATIAVSQDLAIKGAGVRTVTVVESLPFTIEAPKAPNFFGHAWEYKSTAITAVVREHVLEVTAAAKGTIIVHCKWYVVDFDKRTIETKTAFVNFVVGEVTPPKPPEPQPSPDNPFVEAWKQETAQNRSAIVAVIAKLYDGYAAKVDTFATGKAMFDFMSAAYLAATTGTPPEKIQGKLTKLVPAVNAWLAANLSKIPEGALTQTDRLNSAAAFTRISLWLGELK